MCAVREKKIISAVIFFQAEYDLVRNTQILFTAAGITDIGPDEPVQVITPLYFRNFSSVLNQFSTRYMHNVYTLRIISMHISYI